MNATKNKLPAAFRNDAARALPIQNHPAFTLIELLTVIAIIGVLAALLLSAFGAVKRRSLINHADAEMAQLQTAIERYKAAYGFYPPGNTNSVTINQLYYELTGTTNTPSGDFVPLDGNPKIALASVSYFFRVDGFINCTKVNSPEDAPKARDFLPDLKPNQIGTVTNGMAGPDNFANVIVSSIDWPTPATAPISGAQSRNNPWRYNSASPTNNPGAYDLWLQILIKPGVTNLICNWSKNVQINSPLP
jgi:prepilin-type N-terminal cleavage/methylation domain-containing protein